MNVSLIIVVAIIVIARATLSYWVNKKPEGTDKIKKSKEQNYKTMNEAEFQKDMDESTADPFETKEPNENSQKTEPIYLSKENYLDHLFLDVVAFSFAHSGAQGVGGEILVITRDASFYSMNYVYGDMTIEMCEMVCPLLRECKFGFFDADLATFDWKIIYLGGGNLLMLEESLYDRLHEQIADRPPYDLYGEWTDIVLTDIRAHLQDAG